MGLQKKKDILFIAATVIFTYFLVGERGKLVLWFPMILMILVSMHKVKGMIGTLLESRRCKRKFKQLLAKF